MDTKSSFDAIQEARIEFDIYNVDDAVPIWIGMIMNNHDDHLKEYLPDWIATWDKEEGDGEINFYNACLVEARQSMRVGYTMPDYLESHFHIAAAYNFGRMATELHDMIIRKVTAYVEENKREWMEDAISYADDMDSSIWLMTGPTMRL